MQEWDAVLQELADTPEDYNRAGGDIILARHGQEYELSLTEAPRVGLAVKERDGTYVDIATYIQRVLLELPRLAGQIQKALDRQQGKRPGKFVEGPAEFEYGSQKAIWTSAYLEFDKYLSEGEPDTTRIIQLMAAAGKGKTVLLETVANRFAQKYQPDPYPLPIILPIDLLGRYIGTIDDAIAGSLNNTYLFPNLTQRDVILCMKRRWIILALDGFDELVARIGVRDAFLRISELIDQLNGNGAIVLSARESFFDLYQITTGIRTYLQTRRGSYSTSVIRLLPWAQKQGIEVFAGLGSIAPESDLSSLTEAFQGDKDVVFHPFFLTRLAALWLRGERFERAVGQPDTLSRSRYVIETFIERETYEKWKDRDGNPVLTIEGHREMLGAVAEEMWRSGAFTFDRDELRIAAEIGLTDGGFTRTTISDALERIGTHAALQTTTRGFTFLHDRFLHYFLAYRMQKWLRRADEAIIETLAARELPPSIVEWICWAIGRDTTLVVSMVPFLNKLLDKCSEGVGHENIGYLAVQLLNGTKPEAPVDLVGHTITGEALAHIALANVEFRNCRFWSVDIDESSLSSCSFIRCQFGDIRITRKVAIDSVAFVDCSLSALEIEGQGSFFSPEEIAERLTTIGVAVSQAHGQQAVAKLMPIREDVAKLVEKAVKASERTCDIALEELVSNQKLTNFIIRTGEEKTVLREIGKDVSGPRKRFVRFCVDRNKLLRGKSELTGDQRIDGFWEELRSRYPGE